jgi:hypothetical protein
MTTARPTLAKAGRSSSVATSSSPATIRLLAGGHHQEESETASASSQRRSETRPIRPGSESDSLPARPGLRRVRLVGSELGGARFVVILVSRLLSSDWRKPLGLANTLASWATSTKQRSYVAVVGAIDMMHEWPWATAGPRDRPGGGACCLRRHSGRTQPCRPAAFARHWRLTRAPRTTWTLRRAEFGQRPPGNAGPPLPVNAKESIDGRPLTLLDRTTLRRLVGRRLRACYRR